MLEERLHLNRVMVSGLDLRAWIWLGERILER